MPEASRRGIRNRTARPAVANTAVPEGDARIATLTPIPALLREFNCDPARVLASVGFELSVFDNPENRVSFARAGALLEACVAATGVPHFGLLAGSRFDLSMLGVLAQLMRSSDSVRTALQQLVRHLHLNDRGAVGFMVDLNRERFALGYAIYRSDTPGIDQIYDLAMANGVQIMRSLCGPAWKPTLVSFAHGTPPDVAPYNRYFRAPLQFDAAHSEMIVASRWLDQPLAEADPAVRMAAERVALADERGADGRFVERARQAVQGLVMSGGASSPRVAELLGINERVLRRHLHAEGTSIHQLVGSARFEGACQLLRSTHLTLAEIAAALGYSDATAFSRAFRGWTHITPSAWRSQVQAARTRTAGVTAPDIASPARQSRR